MYKKLMPVLLAVVVAVPTVTLVASSHPALAQDDNENEELQVNAPMHFSINSQNHVSMSGATLNAIDTSTSSSTDGVMSVKVFGLSLTVNALNAKITNIGSGKVQLSDLKVGDNLSIAGSIDPTTGVITATGVRDFSLPSNESSLIQSLLNRIAQITAEINSLRAELQSKFGI